MKGADRKYNIRNTWDLTQPEHTLASEKAAHWKAQYAGSLVDGTDEDSQNHVPHCCTRPCKTLTMKSAVAASGEPVADLP